MSLKRWLACHSAQKSPAGMDSHVMPMYSHKRSPYTAGSRKLLVDSQKGQELRNLPTEVWAPKVGLLLLDIVSFSSVTAGPTGSSSPG